MTKLFINILYRPDDYNYRFVIENGQIVADHGSRFWPDGNDILLSYYGNDGLID